MTDNNKVSVITSNNIVNDPTTLPTTKAVFDEISDLERAMDAMEDTINSFKGGVETVDGGDYISTEGSTKTDIKLSLNVSDEIINSEVDKTVPTTVAVKTYVDGMVNDPTAYVFPHLSAEDRKYYIIHDGAMNPVFISFADELEFGVSMFRHRPWKKFHVNLPNLQYTWRIFHDNANLKSLKSAMTNMQSMVELCPSCDKLEYIDLDLSNLEYTGRGIHDYVINDKGEAEARLGYHINGKIFTETAQSSFKATPNLKSVKVAINSRKGIVNFLKEINEGGYGGGDYSKKSGKKLTIGYYTIDEENKNKTFNIYSNEEITSNWNESNVGTYANQFFDEFKSQIKDAHDKGWVINYDVSSSQDLYEFCITNNIITINTEE